MQNVYMYAAKFFKIKQGKFRHYAWKNLANFFKICLHFGKSCDTNMQHKKLPKKLQFILRIQTPKTNVTSPKSIPISKLNTKNKGSETRVMKMRDRAN